MTCSNANNISNISMTCSQVTRALRQAGALANTLVVFTADNGGPTTTGDGVGARNWPLRGGKHSVWEGGTRVTGLISGYGITPDSDFLYRGLMHGADWLPTLSTVAGYSLDGTLPLDGVDQWGYITGATKTGAARTSLVIGNSTNMCSWPKGDPRYHGAATIATAGADLPAGAPELGKVTLGCGFAIRKNDGKNMWKLIKGYGGGPDTWCNSTSVHNSLNCASAGPGSAPSNSPPEPVSTCPGGWCLYDVASDPFEQHEISGSVVCCPAAAVDRASSRMPLCLFLPAVLRPVSFCRDGRSTHTYGRATAATRPPIQHVRGDCRPVSVPLFVW